jgi:hypothetical protein
MEIRIFVPENVFGSKKLVDIKTGDFFPFSTDEEMMHTKELLTKAYYKIEIGENENV